MLYTFLPSRTLPVSTGVPGADESQQKEVSMLSEQTLSVKVSPWPSCRTQKAAAGGREGEKEGEEGWTRKVNSFCPRKHGLCTSQ